MGRLIKAIINFFRGLFGAAASKLEDDVRDGRFAIEDSKKQIAEFTTKIAHLIAESKKMEKKLAASKANVEKWQSIADSAGKKQDWEGAEKALKIKSNATKEVSTLTNEINRTDKIIENLKNQLEAAKARIGNAESDITQLAARKDAADIRTGLAKAAAGLNSEDSPFANLDKLKDKVNAQEAEAEAMEEMTSGGDDADLEAKYGGGGNDVSGDLEALKAKFGKTE